MCFVEADHFKHNDLPLHVVTPCFFFEIQQLKSIKPTSPAQRPPCNVRNRDLSWQSNLAFNLLIDLLVLIYWAVEHISLWYILVEEMVYIYIHLYFFFRICTFMYIVVVWF